MKKSTSDNRSVTNTSDKRLRSEIQTVQTNVRTKTVIVDIDESNSGSFVCSDGSPQWGKTGISPAWKLGQGKHFLKT